MIPDLQAFDWIVINSSAGKDSQAMLDHLVELADKAGVPRGHLVVVHADLGRVEWQGTLELAREQAEHYGLRFEVVTRRQGDLLDHVQKRGKWPSPMQRYCTSDHKRGQIQRLLTQLSRESKAAGASHVNVLNCIGIRAEESSNRAKLNALELDARAGCGYRTVWTWLPIFDWLETQVWDRIRASGVRHHEAYDMGMGRLSCCFCIMAKRSDLLIAGRANRALLDEYVALERELGHTFKADSTIESIRDEITGQVAR